MKELREAMEAISDRIVELHKTNDRMERSLDGCISVEQLKQVKDAMRWNDFRIGEASHNFNLIGRIVDKRSAKLLEETDDLDD